MPDFSASLNQNLLQGLTEFGLRPALHDQNETLTFAQLADRVASCSHRLRLRGVNKGDRVALQLRNSQQAVILMLSALMIGAIPVPILPSYREKELLHILQMTQPKVLALYRSSRRYSPMASLQSFEQQGIHVDIVLVEDLQDQKRQTRYLNLQQFCSPMETPPAQHLEPMSSDDTAMMLLSSGTTGLPKAIARKNGGYTYMIQCGCDIFGLNSQSVYFAVMPVSHGFVINCPGILGTLSRGGAVVLADQPTAAHALNEVARCGVTHTTLVPALLAQWAEVQQTAPRAIDSLWHVQVGGARVAPELAASASATLGIKLQQCYGMSEGLLCFNAIDEVDSIRFQSQGKPLSPEDEVRIVDDRGQPVAIGQSGELITRGPYTITGYFQNPKADLAAFTPEGFYRTGDLAHVDAEGNVYIDGRVNDSINRGGEKFSPNEIEELAMHHPDIQHVACVGAADALYGEVACLFVVSDRQDISLGELRRYLAGQGLASFKIPEKLILLEAIPMKGIGKIDRLTLRAMVAETPSDIADVVTGRE